MQQSGGLLLPPVQTLVATLIFFRMRKKMQIESYIVLLKSPLLQNHPTPIGVG